MDFREAKEIGRDIDADFRSAQDRRGLRPLLGHRRLRTRPRNPRRHPLRPESGIRLKIYTAAGHTGIYRQLAQRVGHIQRRQGHRVARRRGTRVSELPRRPQQATIPSPLLKRGGVRGAYNIQVRNEINNRLTVTASPERIRQAKTENKLHNLKRIIMQNTQVRSYTGPFIVMVILFSS